MRNLKVTALMALTALTVFATQGVGFGPDAQLRLDRDTFSPGEQITVRFKAPAGLPENAWVGIIPSHIQHGSEAINDQHDIAYQYLKGRVSGEMVFAAPKTPGNYDFRLNSTDSDGVELAYVSFRVASCGYAPSAGSAYLSIDKTNFSSGERIAVRFSAPDGLARNAWIGIIPSNVSHGSEATNDQYDVSYQYLEGRTSGVLYFDSPGAGEWDFRLHSTDDNGVELATVSFSVR